MQNSIEMRGIYGNTPTELFDKGATLHDYGINAVFMGSGNLTEEKISSLKEQGARVFAEFNTMHVEAYIKDHPDAAPVGVDGEVCPPPEGWQGVCPTHPGYRQFRMGAFREVLENFDIDGIWLDYHHSHASWERAEPVMPDTCFCERCLQLFQDETGITAPPAELLGTYKEQWVAWRCDVFTDWVREFREIIDAVRPGALFGTYHCPWTDTERDGALRNKLAIDLKAQLPYIDVFSIMPYHARFGHKNDVEWISRQTKWLGEFLGIEGRPDEDKKIWPIVQLSDWGETVPPAQVAQALDHGTRSPSTGVMVFNWNGLMANGQWENVEEMGRFYRTLGV